ncbi:hypothetical protein [Massilia sp. CCM 8734]|uniref:hypothetical protein n=1 Tax=Massilia sp. CCM 8734 TaxID=2609283 RepID=UPI00142149C1|nr:hypothetical protein [Massilia sp. CCM 8734]NHZ99848.1 hypothetical protein [Massilia sp. CCM 8734]
MPSIFMRTASIVDPIVRLARTGAVAVLACLATLVFANARRSLARACGLLALCLGMGSAIAQTPVSGAISVNTRWTVAGGPYMVAGDVVVQNGAVLTIDPGVTAYMGAGASLKVQGGSIKAAGTQALPIKVLSEKTRLGGAAAAGDWKQWLFSPGAVNSQLDHVLFEHGSGLVVQGSSPVFNFLNIRNQLGAAITVDLAASPSGLANQASGNILNGISVPGGDITGSVKWALRGIPYVVANGLVSVGASPAISFVSPESIQAGQTMTVNLTGTRLSGLSSVFFDSAGMSAQVLAGATDTQAAVSVTAGSAVASGPVTMRLLTNAGWSSPNNILSVARAQPTLNSISPSPIYTGQGTVALTVNGRDFTSQSAVLRDGTVLPTQFVSATQLRASIDTPSASSNLAIKVRTPDPLNAGQFLLSNELALPVLTAQLALTPASASIVKGAVRTYTITLPYPAPAGGSSVNLVSSVPTVANLPASVLVPAGQSSATVQLTAAELGATTITASKVGLGSAQAQITVVAPPTLTLAPNLLNLGVGRKAELTLSSSVPAGPGGLVVAVTSSSPATATVVSSVTIAAGSSSAVVSVSTLALGSTIISADAPEFVKASATVKVRPLSLNLPAGALVAPGLTRSIPLTLSDPAPSGGLVVKLVSDNPSAATVPASVTVPQGESSVNFILTGVGTGSAWVNASAAGHEAASMRTDVDTVSIRFGSPAVNSLFLPEEISSTLVVTLSRPAPAGGVVVALASGNAGVAAVSPANVTIAQGETSSGAATVRGVLKGSTTLSGTAQGLSPVSIPVSVSAKPFLQFESSAIVVGKGLQTSEVYLYRRTENGAYSAGTALTVTLTSSDPGKVSVPAKVVIPANSSYVNFNIAGVELTATDVTINATPGESAYAAPSGKLAVKVVNPLFNFGALDKDRMVGSARDDFYLQVNVPGASSPTSQTAAADLPISLSIVDASAAGIVSQFFAASTGGAPVTQVVLSKGHSYTHYASGVTYLDSPLAVGTYKVKATVFGGAGSVSPLVTVGTPQLKFSRTDVVVVGKGMRTNSSEISVSRVANGVANNGAETLTVALTSSDPSKVTVPATVTIPAGSSETPVYVTGVEQTGASPVTITASASGIAPVTFTAKVIVPVFKFSHFETMRTPASVRDDFLLRVNVPGANYPDQTAARDTPIDLTIADANPAGVAPEFYSVQSAGTPIKQVILRKGETYTHATEGVSYVGTPGMPGSYKMQASVAGIGSAVSELVTVSQPDLMFNRSSVVVAKGFDTANEELFISRSVGGTRFKGTNPLTVTLTSSDPTRASVPTTVTIAAGQEYISVPVSGVNLTSATPVTIEATAAGYNASGKVATQVVAPVFSFSELDADRSPASGRDDFYITVATPGSNNSGSQVATTDLPLALSIVDASPAGTVEGFYSAQTGGAAITEVVIRKGATHSRTTNGYTYVATPATSGSYKVRAAVQGGASVTSSGTNVSAPELRFSLASFPVGKGLTSYNGDLTVHRASNGKDFKGVAALTVNLSCTSTAICSVPPSVVIDAGSSYATVQVTGTGIGSTTVTASAVGYSALQDLALSVIAPELLMSGPGNTKVGEASNVSVYFSVPGASNRQSPDKDLVVNLTSSAPGVATVPSTLTFKAGSTTSQSVKMTGVSAGTTTVTASGIDMKSVTSDVITVSP